mmetsp:Transcript_68409/g.164211  ORF Transcript_68409/g.164211 Transcript_68409/m.164211 type:complete len:430 (-) Transcript_68409:93-1382(-)|eukprot:CAMPEP_0178439360 /NCGR_PEP_ID=MMETSP0689_2-20121128/36114_1 /TAXON_ID=160604 /ORGANISM="Amphidinium massartii, Strain CS-259" /LENGTH=429 /DNA_ID=CAMNT_0020061883 /DNA_START=111 /DNA_END=1400 /DNA_ORIENTATION=-
MGEWDPFADPADLEEDPVPVPVPRVKSKSEQPPVAQAPVAPKDESGKDETRLDLDGFLGLLSKLAGTEDPDPWLLNQIKALYPQAPALMAKMPKEQCLLYFQATSQRLLEECAKGDQSSVEFVGVLRELMCQWGGSLGDDDAGLQIERPDAAGFNGHVVLIPSWGGSNFSDHVDTVKWYRSFDAGALIVVVLYKAGSPKGLDQLKQLLDELARQWSSKVQRSLTVHAFSNLGMMCWRDLLKEWAGRGHINAAAGDEPLLPPLKDVLRKIILDSCPDGLLPRSYGTRSNVSTMVAMMHGTLGVNSRGEPRSEEEKVAMYRKSIEVLAEGSPLWRSYDMLSDEEIYAMTRIDTSRIQELEPPVPILFLYSALDKIIPKEGPERYFNECISRSDRKGLLTEKHMFKGTPHCQHKKMKPQEYWDRVQSFLAAG